MSLDLPRFERGTRLVDENGLPTMAFHIWWQTVVNQIEAQEAEQDAIIARIRRINSHTSPTSIFTATENGVTATIVIAAHTRIYGDGTTQAVAGTTLSGLLVNTAYGIYYDDTPMNNPSPVYNAVTTIADAQATKADGRHFCGVIRTPPAGSGQTRTGGGMYPPGSAPGGEL